MAVRSSRTRKLVVGWVVILAMLVPLLLQFAAIAWADPAILWGVGGILLAGVWLWHTVRRRVREAERDNVDRVPEHDRW